MGGRYLSRLEELVSNPAALLEACASHIEKLAEPGCNSGLVWNDLTLKMEDLSAKNKAIMSCLSGLCTLCLVWSEEYRSIGGNTNLFLLVLPFFSSYF